MIVLGISDSITSGAALVIDGNIVAAVNEERLNREKMSMGFPNLSIAEVLRISGVQPQEVDKVVVATKTLFWRPNSVPFSDYFRKKKGGGWDSFLNLGSVFSPLLGNSSVARKTYLGLKTILTHSRHDNIKRVLKEQFGITAPLRFLDHHLCHAASAYFTCGHEDATIVTMDGAGDGKCSRVYRATQGKLEELHSLESYHSIGNYYAYVTHICGFKAHKHEGKITGLAAYGEPNYLDLLYNYLSYNEGNINNTGKCFDHSAIHKLERELSSDFSKADLSASIQFILEEAVTRYFDYWVKKSGFPDLAIAGGVFANVKLNQRINELDSVRNIFIHPGMGDEGLALGAALYEYNQHVPYETRPVIKDVYFGSEPTDAGIRQALENHSCKPIDFEGPIELKIAQLLATGKVVALYRGGMEYGPRALGNRSILYQPTDPDVNNWLNKRLVRTEFMPFAPVVLWEERSKCFERIGGADETARFMTITFDCTSWMKQACPAVCHVDGTARPQVIREEDNKTYYRIVKNYQSLTGLPCVINTSFNMHEEPIVNTPEDAIRSFKLGHLDYLAIGNYLVKNEESFEEAPEWEKDSSFSSFPSLQDL